jgi:DNA-binding NarL/FixJ family response regulator
MGWKYSTAVAALTERPVVSILVRQPALRLALERVAVHFGWRLDRDTGDIAIADHVASRPDILVVTRTPAACRVALDAVTAGLVGTAVLTDRVEALHHAVVQAAAGYVVPDDVVLGAADAPSLTGRQLAVLHGVLRADDVTTVTDRLGMSPESVRLEVDGLLAAFGVAHRAELLRKAVAWGYDHALDHPGYLLTAGDD